MYLTDLMNRPRYKLFLLILLAGAAQIAAQLQTPLTGNNEPFRIKPGSAFSASGGSKMRNSAAARSVAREIREAQAIILDNYFDTNENQAGSITKSALESMLHTLDPHSNFHDANEWKKLLEEQNSGYTGIGASIGEFTDGRSTDIFVLSVLARSPAGNAGLRFGDKIVSVDGRQATGKGLVAVRDMIRGSSGSTLKLKVERSSTGRMEDLVLQRIAVHQPSIPDAYILRPGVGYIDLTEGFNHTTSDEFDKALRNLKRQGMRSLVLDLRWNGGGILDQAVMVAEKFLPAGTQILSQRGRGPLDTRIYRSDTAVAETMPLVVLVNDRTASASEIVAGAFQDHDRAVIIGEKTYGKGLVQTVIDLPGGAGLTLTTGRYLTPSGRSIQRDYSSVDLYDYYNKRTPASGIDKAYFEARTATDRRVFGGDGIRPDETVKSMTLNATQASLVDPIFFFAREAIMGRVAGNENYRSVSFSFGKRIGSGDFLVSDSLLAAFNSFVERDKRGRFAEGSLRAETAFIRLRLRYYLAMASLGAVSANQVLIEGDPQVAKAVISLPRATRLTQSAAKAKRQLK